MFDSPTARYVLRVFLVGVGAFCASLQASSYGSGLDQAEIVNALLGAVVVALAYAGIGAAVPAVEPNIGNTMPNPQDGS